VRLRPPSCLRGPQAGLLDNLRRPGGVPYRHGRNSHLPREHGAMCGLPRSRRGWRRWRRTWVSPATVCSYARTDIARGHPGRGHPGGLPEPDFLLACNNICGTVMKCTNNCPLLQRPHVHDGHPFIHKEKPEHSTEYVRNSAWSWWPSWSSIPSEVRPEEVRRGGAFKCASCGAVEGRPEDRRDRPSPFTCFDAFVHMAP